MIEACDDRARLGPEFGIESVGIAFEYRQVGMHRANFILVDGPLGEFRHKKFPYAGQTAITHGVRAAVPLIEVSHQAAPHGVWRPPSAFYPPNSPNAPTLP